MRQTRKDKKENMTEEEYREAVEQAAKLYSLTYNCRTVEEMVEKRTICNSYVDNLIARCSDAAAVKKDIERVFDEKYYGKIPTVRYRTSRPAKVFS